MAGKKKIVAGAECICGNLIVNVYADESRYEIITDKDFISAYESARDDDIIISVESIAGNFCVVLRPRGVRHGRNSK